jgi:hypothetical protein
MACQGDPQRATGNQRSLMAKNMTKMGPITRPGTQITEQRGQAPGVILPAPAPRRGEKTERNSHAQGEAKRRRAQRQRDRQALRDDVADRMVAVLERRPEIAVQDAAEVAEVLLPERLVEVVLGAQVALDFRRRRLAVAVKRPARHGPHQGEGQEADDQQQRNQKENALDEVHSIQPA